VLGVTVFLLMQNYLQQFMGMAASALPVPILSALLSPDRWLFWLGVAFVASVYFFPSGIVGSLRAWSPKE
jgi:branched-chain amino acid transport system permease protein